MKDWLERELRIGDRVVWAVNTSTSGNEFDCGEIKGFISRKDGDFVEIQSLRNLHTIRKRSDKIIKVQPN